jgi:NADH-quinone oxidoreductase subunit G
VGARGLRLGTYRSIWAAPEVEVSPSLHFTRARQQLEISPADARALGLKPGQRVSVAVSGNGASGRSVAATVAVRSSVTPGVVFLQESIAEDAANALANGHHPLRVEVRG